MFFSSIRYFFFLRHPVQFIAKNILSPGVELSGECRTHNMHFMVFPSAVHLRFQFYLWVFTNHIIMLLSWGPRCLGSASSAPWRLRRLRHLRGLRPLQVKTKSWGRIYNIYSSSGEVKNGIYCWPVISQTRSCVGGSPCSRGGEPGSFWCGKPPRE